jgi:hypothetical protein
MQLVLDIENTVIDDLTSLNFMQENCEKIKDFIDRYKPLFVHLFTWGWKDKDDIRESIVDSIFDRLGLDGFTRGCVYTKSDSVDYAISREWLKESDRGEVLNPGMMAAYGLGKIHLVVEQLANNDLSKYDGYDYVIIDDLVRDDEHRTRPYHNILLLNPAKEFGELKIYN